MEPVFMVLGQSAATAAVLAMNSGVELQSLPFTALREELRKDGQVLDLPPSAKKKVMVSGASLPGIVLDDAEATVTGPWTHSTSAGKFVGVDYLHDGDTEKGEKSIVWTLKAPASGEFELRMSYSANANRAANVPILISVNGKAKAYKVDQQQVPEIDGLFHPLDRFKLQQNDELTIHVSNKGTIGHVIADAVQLLPIEKRSFR